MKKIKTIIRISFTSMFLICLLKTAAQVTTPVAHIDPSKPTNQYTRLSNNLEYNFSKSGKKTYGYRANFIWASRRHHHSLYTELPLLYATSSKKSGLSDMRFRYYWVPYKNYSKKPGAFGFAIDSYVPTGKLEDGLGRNRWIVATGLSTAFVFGKFSTFPYIYYLYSSEIRSDKISAAAKRALNGYIIQSICVYNINKNSYLDCTPIFMKNSYSNSGKDDFVVEGNYLYMVKQNKIQIGCFARRYFLGNSTTIRAAMRIYF
ncbi:MAG: hypothetical protein ABI863_11560 [Ginsengibacter sp.]